MGDTMDLTFLEGAGILVVMLVTMFIDEINPWITTVGGGGIACISWLVYQFFLTPKEIKYLMLRGHGQKKNINLRWRFFERNQKTNNDND